MKKIIIFNLFVLMTFNVLAQHNLQSSLYPKERFLINAANTGDHDQKPYIFLGYRYDFTGISGTLRRSMLAMHSPVSGNVGLGGILSMEQLGIFQYYNIVGNYSYLVNISKKSSLRLGVTSGLYFRDINHSKIKVNEQQDILLSTENNSRVYFFSGIGAEWTYSRFFVSASIPKLYAAEDNIFLANAIGGLGYKFDMLEAYLTPSVFVHYYQQNPVRVDFNLLYNMPEKFFVLLSLKSDISASLGAGIDINDMNLSYVYDYQKELWPSSKGSHEIILSYTFQKLTFSKGRR